MTNCRKRYIKVIRNKGTEDCYIATCNDAMLHNQCTEYQGYNKTNYKNNIWYYCIEVTNIQKYFSWFHPNRNHSRQHERQWDSNNLFLSVVKDVPRPWFLTSLPSSVRFMYYVIESQQN